MISGYVCVRQGDFHDYCWRESVRSLIPVCDEVVISVGTSTDGTREGADELAKECGKIRILDYDWGNPVSDIHWWTRYLNWTRERLKFDMQLTLDADEVLDPCGYDLIRESADKGLARWLHRRNWWSDLHHLAPFGRVCGEQVVRLAPTRMWMCSDEPHPEGQPEYEIRTMAGWPPNADEKLVIHHYGFLRKNEAFIEKVRTVNGAFFGCSDPRVERSAAEGAHWTKYVDHGTPLIPFEATHPEVAHEWLKARGFNP